jgi:hypothetical protein
VQLALLLHEQSDFALLLVKLVDQQSAWLDQTSFPRAVFHGVVASLTLEVNVQISAAPLHTVKEPVNKRVSLRERWSGLSSRDLRMLELELILDVNVRGALVLELLNEAVCFLLLLRLAIWFQGPALSDLEDL